MAQSRTSSWKRLLGETGPQFLDWLEKNETCLTSYNKFADVLEPYLISQLSSPTLCRQFLECLPEVHDQCDDPATYKMAMAIEAYAYAHLLERYRRFWDVLVILLRAKVLPMRESGIDVLDIGTGPAPTLYAVSDFYQALYDFALVKGFTALATPLPQLDGVESSPHMVHFFHVLSEVAAREGPFSVSCPEFEGLDFAALRRQKKWAMSQGEEYYDHELETWETWYTGDIGSTEDLFRYNFVVFSNFLTQEKVVVSWEKELGAIFHALRPGGVVVIIGGITDEYQSIYNFVSSVAVASKLIRIPDIPGEVPCNYFEAYEPYGKRLRQFYDTVWNWMKENCNDIDQVANSLNEPKLSKFWTPSKKLTVTPKFGLRVFRKGAW